MTKRILRLKRVLDKTGRCRSSIYSDMNAGTFPQPIKLGAKSIGWLESDIDGWIDEKVRASKKDNERAA